MTYAEGSFCCKILPSFIKYRPRDYHLKLFFMISLTPVRRDMHRISGEGARSDHKPVPIS